MQSGSSTQVQQTAHWTAVIFSIALSIALIISVLAQGAVVVRDGNSALVTTALQNIAQLGGTFALVAAVVAGGPQVVSVLATRFGIGLPGSLPDATTPAPAVAPAAAPSVATVTISAATPQAISVAPPLEPMAQQKASE